MLQDRAKGPLEQRGEQDEVLKRIIRRWRLFRLLQLMPSDVVNDQNALQRVVLSEPGGSSAEVLLRDGQVVSWKDNRGEQLLFVRNKNTGRSPVTIFGGISICFPQASNSGNYEQPYAGNRVWSFENGSPNQAQNGSSHSSTVNLICRSSDKDLKMWPCRFELRLNISLAHGKLTLMPSVTNVGDKSFSFTFAISSCLSVSDISEVRVEGLETLDYMDNILQGRTFTEQADALTFDGEISRTYLNTPSEIAVLDHGKKTTFVLRKQGLPDAVVWNPWGKPSKCPPYLGDEYQTMLCVDSAALGKPITLKPLQVWRGFLEIARASSSYCGGQLMYLV